MVKNSPWSTVTNSNSYFALVGILKGKIYLTVTYIGYEMNTKKLIVVQSLEKNQLN